MKLEITQMAWDCLAEIESFAITKGHPSSEAADLVEGLLLRSAEAISENPEMYRFSPRLAEFGLKMRERLDESSHWCLYEIENDTIYIMLFYHTRQDLERALYRHQIIR